MPQLGFAPLTETINAAIEAVRKPGDDF